VPHSYAISGISFIVPLANTKKLPKHMNAAEAMKYAISGGVTTTVEEDKDAVHLSMGSTGPSMESKD
jgi:uncharacterized membrane protein